MANIKVALGNVMDAIVGTSNAACNVVNLVGKTAQAGNNWMDHVLDKQQTMLKVDSFLFKNNYAEEKAQELAAKRKQTEEWAELSPRHKQLYEEALEQIKAVL